MNDDFIAGLREEPRPEFRDALERRLREVDESERRRQMALRPRRRRAGWAAAAVFVAGLGLSLGLPAVRAAAREFLDLFRVKRFAAVLVDTERFKRLEQGGVDLKALVGGQVEVLEPEVKPQVVDGTVAAAEFAGIDIRELHASEPATTLTEVRVNRPGAFRLHFDAAKLEELARLLGVDDPRVPPAIDGAIVDVHTSPVVALRYARGDSEFVLLQSRNPEIGLPPGVDPEQLGTLALQMAGMSAEEARLFARDVDWGSTLLVPIPADGGNFREVDVNGVKGLLMTSFQRPTPGADGHRRSGHWRALLLWSSGDRVFALTGPGNGLTVLELAQSVG